MRWANTFFWEPARQAIHSTSAQVQVQVQVQVPKIVITIERVLQKGDLPVHLGGDSKKNNSQHSAPFAGACR
jgi:hypothetical protein